MGNINRYLTSEHLAKFCFFRKGSPWNTQPQTDICVDQDWAIQGGICPCEEQDVSSKLAVSTCKGFTDLRFFPFYEIKNHHCKRKQTTLFQAEWIISLDIIFP